MNIEHNKYLIIRNRSSQALPGIAMVFSCTKNDEILVPGLLEAFYFCDFFVCYYDDGVDFHYNEAERHLGLINTAKRHGAKWIYLTQSTLRLGDGWRDLMLRWLSVERPIILRSSVYYFWDYSLDTVRTDLTPWKVPCFFRVHHLNSFSHDKLHHMATPTIGERVNTNLVRYNLNRLGPEVCIAKADYYQAKDGTPHDSLRDFSKLTTKKIEPSTIRGVGPKELEYIKQIEARYK